MMTRAAAPEAFPVRTVAVLAISVFALGVLAYDVPSNAGVQSSASDLLHRAEVDANAKRFGQLMGTAEEKDGEKKSKVETKPATKSEAKTEIKSDSKIQSDANAVVKTTTPAVVAQPAPEPIVKAAKVSASTTSTSKASLAVAPKKSKQRDAKLRLGKLPAISKSSRESWVNIGRKWAAAVGHGF